MVLRMEKKSLFDDCFIERILNIYDFDVDRLEVNKINYVHMNDYKFSSIDRTCLLTFNLQCCVAVYLYGNGFGFLAHINTTKGNLSSMFFDLENNSFLLSELLLKKLKQYCMFSNKYNNFYIGLVTGSCPYPQDYVIMKSINSGINKMVNEAKIFGINLCRVSNISLSDFVLNTDDGTVITSKYKIKVRNIKKG